MRLVRSAVGVDLEVVLCNVGVCPDCWAIRNLQGVLARLVSRAGILGIGKRFLFAFLIPDPGLGAFWGLFFPPLKRSVWIQGRDRV